MWGYCATYLALFWVKRRIKTRCAKNSNSHTPLIVSLLRSHRPTNIHPRWKLYFRRFCADYQLAELSLTIFSQIYHTIRDDVERLEGKLDKQMIRIVWNLRKSFLTHCAIYYIYCFIVNLDKMNFNPIWERICLKLLEFKKDEKYRGKESHKKREPSLLGSLWYKV